MKKALLVLIISSILITFFVFLPYSIHINDSLPNSIDPVFYAWNLSHNLQSASRGFKNLLDTNIFYPEGNTLALSDTLYAQTPLTLPIIALTKNPVLAENLYVLATFPLSAITMFLLVYYLTRSSWASFFSGIFYAFSYPRLAQIGHMPALSSQWLPLVFLYLIKWVREKKFWNLIQIFIWYLASITSTMYFGVFLIPLSGVIIVFEISNDMRDFVKLLRHFFIIFIPAVALLILVLFPYIRLRAEYPGIRRSVDDAVRLSATPKDYFTILPTTWIAKLGLPTDTNERPLYPTLTLTTLALYSLFITRTKSRKTIIEFFFLSVAALILSLGPQIGSVRLPYYYLYKIFPLLESIRVPARFSIFVILGFSVCSAFTLQTLIQKKKGTIIAFIIFLFFLSEVWQLHIPYVHIPLWNEAPAVYKFLEYEPDDSIIAELPLRPEWTSVRMENQLMLTYAQVTEHDVYALEAYRTYFSAFHHKRMINGYSGYFPNVYHDHSILLDTFPSEDSLFMLKKEHVRYILVHSKEYVNVPFAEIREKIREFPELKLIRQFGPDYVYTL